MTTSTTASTDATARVVALRRFQTPTGNIACDLGGSDAAVVGGVRCDIRDKTWVPPPKPADCELDWGGSLPRRRSRHGHPHQRHGLRPLPAHALLRESSRVGAITCSADPTA